MLIRIKEVPHVQNPNPRPTTASRPGTQANGRKVTNLYHWLLYRFRLIQNIDGWRVLE